MLSLVGIPEEDREKAERMVKVALWCVQYLPKTRPMMSSVVKMLEGGIDIDTPPNPFDHLDDNLPLGGGSKDSSSNQYSSSEQTQTNSFQPVQSNKLEIQIATI
uniref:Receptor protein serine/threonine kinase n=1 Tax=Opuntia streptacantha TaxID=393608 RepID=A0A7C8YZV9_OPUST